MLRALATPVARAALIAAATLFPTTASAQEADEGRAAPDAAVPASAAAPEPAAAVADAEAPDVPGHKLFPLPFLFYQPETKFGGGVGVLHTYRAAADARTSSNGLFFVVTQRRQFSIAVMGERYTSADRWRLAAMGTWSRFPSFFYGIGNDTREGDKEEFTPRQVLVGWDARRQVLPGLYAGVLALYQHTRIVARESGRAIDAQAVPGSRGGTNAGVGVAAMFDDRDRVYSPRRGHMINLTFTRHDAALGSDFELWRAELDARAYRSLGKRHAVAAQLLTTIATGAPAFYDRAALGGPNVLRGYYEGRYRDRARLVAQLEHRFPFGGRLGGAAFVGAGQAVGSLGDLRLDAFHVAGGAGLRWLVSRDDGVNLRMDIGVGNGDSGVYFAFGDAF